MGFILLLKTNLSLEIEIDLLISGHCCLASTSVCSIDRILSKAAEIERNHDSVYEYVRKKRRVRKYIQDISCMYFLTRRFFLTYSYTLSWFLSISAAFDSIRSIEQTEVLARQQCPDIKRSISISNERLVLSRRINPKLPLYVI